MDLITVMSSNFRIFTRGIDRASCCEDRCKIMTRITFRSYGLFMVDLQHFLFLKNKGQLPSIPYTQYVAKTGNGIIYNMVHSGTVCWIALTYTQLHKISIFP